MSRADRKLSPMETHLMLWAVRRADLSAEKDLLPAVRPIVSDGSVLSVVIAASYFNNSFSSAMFVYSFQPLTDDGSCCTVSLID